VLYKKQTEIVCIMNKKGQLFPKVGQIATVIECRYQVGKNRALPQAGPSHLSQLIFEKQEQERFDKWEVGVVLNNVEQ
jgi:hypothetical protein